MKAEVEVPADGAANVDVGSDVLPVRSSRSRDISRSIQIYGR